MHKQKKKEKTNVKKKMKMKRKKMDERKIIKEMRDTHTSTYTSKYKNITLGHVKQR